MSQRHPDRLILTALIAAAACASPAIGQAPGAKPSLSIEPVTATGLLSPLEADRAPRSALWSGDSGAVQPHQSYRLADDPRSATGKRAKLSIAIGDGQLFAIAGRLKHAPDRRSPDPVAAVSSRGTRGGKVYGAGFEQRVGAFELGATYQYSKISAEHPEVDSAAGIGSGDRSHSVRATARIRFRQ